MFKRACDHPTTRILMSRRIRIQQKISFIQAPGKSNIMKSAKTECKTNAKVVAKLVRDKKQGERSEMFLSKGTTGTGFKIFFKRLRLGIISKQNRG